MAVRKLSLPLFSAKTLVSQPGRSTRYLHFIDSVRQDRNQYSLVCESQPLLSFGSDGLPARCPACGAQIRSKENANSADGLRVSS
jgi:hypothetical protein